MLERNHHSDALCLDMAFFHRPGHLSKPMHGTLCLKFMHFTLCKFYLEKSTINKPWTPLNDNRDQSVLGKKSIQISATYLGMYHESGITKRGVVTWTVNI